MGAGGIMKLNIEPVAQNRALENNSLGTCATAHQDRMSIHVFSNSSTRIFPFQQNEQRMSPNVRRWLV